MSLRPLTLAALFPPALVAFALAACTSADTPVDPVWGKQACGHCAMLVSDRSHGAQAVDARGERLFFDDLGCLIAWEAQNPQANPKHWVRRADTQDWGAPETTRFAHAEHSPMDFGFQGVTSGGAVGWTEVTAAVKQRLAATAGPAPPNLGTK